MEGTAVPTRVVVVIHPHYNNGTGENNVVAAADSTMKERSGMAGGTPVAPGATVVLTILGDMVPCLVCSTAVDPSYSE